MPKHLRLPGHPSLEAVCDFSEPFLIILLFRDFRIEDGKAVIPLGITVQGDVLIVIYHARSTLGGRLQAKVRGCSGHSGLSPWVLEEGPWPSVQ